ncbi:unnamed protein product [Porites evermanni]|uniref:Uncharacterized protein n=1 Tax=Porites evermanni TaxID=104178 RepID=A0ABN8SAK8_9CNID|nr:unnamed protein product [Porites evermanni]
MDTSPKLPQVGDDVQLGEKMKTEKEAILCTPFCEDNCAFRGKHNELILSLVRLHETDRISLEEWKASVISGKLTCDLNEPLQDPNPNPDFCFSLLHWAAVLGKVKAIEWLLTQDLVTLRRDNTQVESNKKVVFSMVRYLHEGVKTKDPSKISMTFGKILDLLLKQDPGLLLVKEDDTSNTILHLCAQGEEDSNAPFLKYLRMTLVKLNEISAKNKALTLQTILEQKNGEGDTFIEVAAKFQNQKEAGDLIDFVREKFPLSTKNAQDTLKKRTFDAIENDDDDDVDKNDVEADDEHLNATDFRNEEQGCYAVYKPVQTPPAKIPRITDESQDPLPVGVRPRLDESNLRHLDNVSQSNVSLLPVEEPIGGLASSNHGVKLSGLEPSTTSDVASETESSTNEITEAKAVVKNLIQKMEQKLLQEGNKLKDATLERAKMELEITKLQRQKIQKDAEIKEMEKTMSDIKGQLNEFKTSLMDLAKPDNGK